MAIAEHDDLARKGHVLRLPALAGGSMMLDQPVEDVRQWTRNTIRRPDWTIELDDAAINEVMAMIRRMQETPLPLLLLHPDQFELHACREVMRRVKQSLSEGIGLVVIDRLPTDRISAAEATAVFWTLGYFLSTPVATKWDGTMLYDVTDTGRRFGYGVRGSATNVELSFHTDNAFGVAIPDYVGLLCIRPALQGGISRFCNLYAAHNAMLRHDAALLRRLYQPAFYDRQAEHASEAPKILWAPLFQYDGKRLSARLTPNLIRRGYDIAGEKMDDLLIEALDCLEKITRDEEYWIEFRLEAGQMQYVQNHWCAHFRSAFTDGDDPANKRHLIRVWYREKGARTYDG
jgi:hypothetical protein